LIFLRGQRSSSGEPLGRARRVPTVYGWSGELLPERCATIFRAFW